MSWPEPPEIPLLALPEAPDFGAPVLSLPKADLPSYKPLVVPPSDLRPPPGVKGEGSEKESAKPNIPKESQIVDIPFTDISVPMPTTTIMTTAATTSVISVAATLTATSVFKYLVMVLKPVFKQAWTKLTKKKAHPQAPKRTSRRT